MKATSRLIHWTRTLRELYYHGKPEEVLQQYHNRPKSFSDVSVQTYCLLFKACTSTKNWFEGQQLHSQIKTNTTFYNDQRLKIASRLKIKISSFIFSYTRLF